MGVLPDVRRGCLRGAVQLPGDRGVVQRKTGEGRGGRSCADVKENVLERNARMDTDRKIADFRVKQQMDYAFKVKYARIRAWEFYNHPDVAGNCYVAVGGLDSITLLLFLRSIGIDVPAVSVSSLEDKSIQSVHKQLGVQPLKPLKSKVEVLREYGWPVISKEVAGKISLLQNPSEKKRDGSSCNHHRRNWGLWWIPDGDTNEAGAEVAGAVRRIRKRARGRQLHDAGLPCVG